MGNSDKLKQERSCPKSLVSMKNVGKKYLTFRLNPGPSQHAFLTDLRYHSRGFFFLAL